MFRYFAYGSVLSLAHAREWCDSHGLLVAPFLAGEQATLPGFRIAFDVPSRFWSGLVADLAVDPSSAVEGVLFTLGDDAREAVLRKEGVATGLYRESIETVRVGGREERASIFTAEPGRRGAAGPASARYLAALLEGAKERGLSAEWQARLASFAHDANVPPPPGVSLGVKRG